MEKYETKEKESLLSNELSKKWLPAKLVAQKQQQVKESEIIAKKKLSEGPKKGQNEGKREKKGSKYSESDK